MLPYWGRPEYLFETVNSVIAQDSDLWRLTVIDDCYPDERVSEYFSDLDNPHVTYRRNDTNIGIIENFRRCVAESTADYLVILGSDDRLRSNYVSTIHKAIERYPGIEIIQPGVAVIDANGWPSNPLADQIKDVLRPRTPHGPRAIHGERACSTLLTGDWLYWPSLAFRRDILQKTPFRDFELILDLALVIDILASDGRLLVVPVPCFEYRRHTESLSGNKKLFDGSRFLGEREYFQLAARQMRDRGWHLASIAARLHLVSRMYAATLIPSALRNRNGHAIRMLLHHVFWN